MKAKSFISFVDTILSWLGTDGQCLAAFHIHISALEPDQLTHLCSTNVTCWTDDKHSFQWEKRIHHQNLRDYWQYVAIKGGCQRLAHFRCGSDWKRELEQSAKGGYLKKKYSNGFETRTVPRVLWKRTLRKDTLMCVFKIVSVKRKLQCLQFNWIIEPKF